MAQTSMKISTPKLSTGHENATNFLLQSHAESLIHFWALERYVDKSNHCIQPSGLKPVSNYVLRPQKKGISPNLI